MPQMTSNVNIAPLIGLLTIPILAIYIGSTIGDENYLPLGLLAAGILCLVAVVLAQKFLLAIGLSLAVLDLWMAPAGFKMSSIEQAGLVAALLWLSVFWRKEYNKNAETAYLSNKWWNIFQAVVLLSVVYAGIHFLVNFVFPFDDLSFGWKAASKTYLQVYGPWLMIVVAAHSRLLRPINDANSRSLLLVFGICALVSFLIKLIHSLSGGGEMISGMDFQERAEWSRTFTIPILNIWDNIYTLRTIGPASTLVGATFFFCCYDKTIKRIAFVIMAVGIFGSGISGGRAAIFFSLAFIGIVLIKTKKTSIAFVGAGAIGLVLIILTVLPSDLLERLPWQAQRAVGMLRPDLNTLAVDTIQGSSDMRKRYFEYAWEYWSTGNQRLIFFGRSVSSMDAQDVLSFELADEAQVMFFAIRRLATHNGITDLLIGWGLVGYLFNVIIWTSCFFLLRSYERNFQKGSYAACWIFIARVFLVFYAIYMSIGGSMIWAINIWFILVALAHKKIVPSMCSQEIFNEVFPGISHENPKNDTFSLRR